jgi:prostaglandin-endoperoxide synthase 2
MGLINSIGRSLLAGVNRWSFAQRWASRFAINRIIRKAPRRPNPFSQMSNYTSWDSLTDRSYTGRHLPVDKELTAKLRPVDDVLPLFRYREHDVWTPSKRSALLFSYFAQWFTDGFLRTKRSAPPDPSTNKRLQNESNHDVDLSPLYGLNKEQTDVLRLEDSGKLKSQMINGEEYPLYLYGDAFTDEEILTLNMLVKRDMLHSDTFFAMGGERSNIQIGYVMFNVLFLREHNRICSLLEGEYGFDPERSFQTARMINIVLLLKLVIEEYINHITPTPFQLVADPLSFKDEPWHRQNWMSVEFNLLYRWHSLTPPVITFDGVAKPMLETVRNNGLITSRGLGPLFDEASRQPAGDMALHNTWDFLVDRAEKAALLQGRNAELASFNAYREAFSLDRLDSFEELTSDKKLLQELKDLYGHIDNLEYFVGIFAEEKKGDAILPELMTRMVAVEAFSHALNNPLFAPRVFHAGTFTELGMQIIDESESFSDILHRNIPPGGEFGVSLRTLDSND